MMESIKEMVFLDNLKEIVKILAFKKQKKKKNQKKL